ncbi:MAG TPA: hypothetical protein VEN99_13730, partial [Acidimicrobiia bacterium]|nr:hypothetical protein [Acidimicrobiia bacterium]
AANPPVANSTMALKNRNNSFQGSMGDLLRDLTVRRPSGVGHGGGRLCDRGPRSPEDFGAPVPGPAPLRVT